MTTFEVIAHKGDRTDKRRINAECIGDAIMLAAEERGWSGNETRARAVDPYRDDECAERACEHCGRTYRGPSVYCSRKCADADA